MNIFLCPYGSVLILSTKYLLSSYGDNAVFCVFVVYKCNSFDVILYTVSVVTWLSIRHFLYISNIFFSILHLFIPLQTFFSLISFLNAYILDLKPTNSLIGIPKYSSLNNSGTLLFSCGIQSIVKPYVS